ncbi:MAG: hypothetical protein RR090_12020 [Niameybacter sp.]|uniref:hypothetical protein n=1 Tax=Niameybacter sp. TaxID=2033640 RepID=UPI002FC93A14
MEINQIWAFIPFYDTEGRGGEINADCTLVYLKDGTNKLCPSSIQAFKSSFALDLGYPLQLLEAKAHDILCYKKHFPFVLSTSSCYIIVKTRDKQSKYDQVFGYIHLDAIDSFKDSCIVLKNGTHIQTHSTASYVTQKIAAAKSLKNWLLLNNNCWLTGLRLSSFTKDWIDIILEPYNPEQQS